MDGWRDQRNDDDDDHYLRELGERKRMKMKDNDTHAYINIYEIGTVSLIHISFYGEIHHHDEWMMISSFVQALCVRTPLHRNFFYILLLNEKEKKYIQT